LLDKYPGLAFQQAKDIVANWKTFSTKTYKTMIELPNEDDLPKAASNYLHFEDEDASVHDR
jgi:hypothetical protein